MVCLVCHRPFRGRLCYSCVGTLRPGGERLLPGGHRVVAAFEHTGAAVTLVHHLKYRGFVPYAAIVADILAEKVEPLPLVPVPRAWSRRLLHGVDPSLEIAIGLGRLWGAPVYEAMTRPVHTRRRAGRNHGRSVAPFRNPRRVRGPIYLIDDVVTTGRTVATAADAIGPQHVRAVLTANMVEKVSSLFSSSD